MGKNWVCALILGLMIIGSIVPINNYTQAVTYTNFFFDDFDTENGSTPQLNYYGFAKWNVVDGSVDLIGSGSKGTAHDLLPSNGLYLDLDGSTSNAGKLVSKSVSLSPGTYDVIFDLAGSQRGDTNYVIVTLSNDMGISSDPTKVERASSDPFTSLCLRFKVNTASSWTLTFDHE